MSVPQPKQGLQASGMVTMNIAVQMLEQALPAFGTRSQEGETILKCLTLLRKHVGEKDHSDLVPAEVMQMVARMQQMGGGTQLQRQLVAQMKGQPPAVPQGAPTPPGGGAPQMGM